MSATPNPQMDPRYIEGPLMTADGKPWLQACYVCRRWCEILKWKGLQIKPFLHVGNFVRHKKCFPGMPK